MEVQAHGVQFEDEIIFKITGCRKEEYQNLIEGAYVSTFDIHKGLLEVGKNYSIKVAGGNGIGCADILRFYRNCKDVEFNMIVGCWKQETKTHKHYHTIYEFIFVPENFPKIWNNIDEKELEEFVQYVKNIPAGKDAQLKNRKLWKEKREILYSKGKGLARIDAKIDSKNQRRVQCSLMINELKDAGIDHVKYTDEYKGIKLPYVQESGKRTFSKT